MGANRPAARASSKCGSNTADVKAASTKTHRHAAACRVHRAESALGTGGAGDEYGSFAGRAELVARGTRLRGRLAQNVYCPVERKARNISLDNLERIAIALGVQAYLLLKP